VALVAREWTFFIVSGNDILSQLGSQLFQQITPVTDERKIAEYRMLLLKQIVNGDAKQQRNDDTKKDRPEHPTLRIPDPISLVYHRFPDIGYG
jgi:hypothetical protein